MTARKDYSYRTVSLQRKRKLFLIKYFFYPKSLFVAKKYIKTSYSQNA